MGTDGGGGPEEEGRGESIGHIRGRTRGEGRKEEEGGGVTVVEQDIQGVESELIHIRIINIHVGDYQKCQDEEETLDTKIPRRECRVWFGRGLLPQ